MASGARVQMSDEQLLEAIKKSGGIVSTIAKRLNLAWSTTKDRINEKDIFKQALRDEKEIMGDMAESTILKAIKDEDVSAAKWYLSTQFRNRGYAEKLDIEHSGTIKINPPPNPEEAYNE